MSVHVGRRERDRRSFTLVEILVVVVIVGILAGLIAAALMAARTSAIEANIKLEIKQLEMALEEYKKRYGEYPPTGEDGRPRHQNTHIGVKRQTLWHVRKVFPHYRLSGNVDQQWNQLCSDVRNGSGIDVDDLNAGSALVFWLGGLPEQAGTGEWRPAGFHADRRQPFKPGPPRTKPYFDFDPRRIRPDDPDNDGYVVLQYYPPRVPDTPYVYFRPMSRHRTWSGRQEYGLCHRASGPRFFRPLRFDFGASYVSGVGIVQKNVAVPYLDSDPQPQPWPPYGNEKDPVPDPPRRWRCPDTYQIICAGLDGRFGGDGHRNDPQLMFRYTRTGANFSPYDYDNITNFTELATLEDEL